MQDAASLKGQWRLTNLPHQAFSCSYPGPGAMRVRSLDTDRILKKRRFLMHRFPVMLARKLTTCLPVCDKAGQQWAKLDSNGSRKKSLCSLSDDAMPLREAVTSTWHQARLGLRRSVALAAHASCTRIRKQHPRCLNYMVKQ